MITVVSLHSRKATVAFTGAHHTCATYALRIAYKFTVIPINACRATLFTYSSDDVAMLVRQAGAALCTVQTIQTVRAHGFYNNNLKKVKSTYIKRKNSLKTANI